MKAKITIKSTLLTTNHSVCSYAVVITMVRSQW
jgi:hypothetical protein